MTKTISLITRIAITATLGLALSLFMFVTPVFAAVTTDKDDYTPGETVTFSGDGYFAGENVSIEVTAPYGSESGVAVANGSGEFSWAFVLPNDESAFGVYSYTATGESSGIVFSGTFTDNKNFTITFAGTGGGSIAFSGVFLTPAPSINPCTSTCVNSLNNNATGTLTVTPNVGSVFAGWSGSFVSGGTTTCVGTTSPCTFSLDNDAQALTATFNLITTATLTVTKTVVNDNGGTATISDFALFIDGFPTTSGTASTISVGAHTVSETPQTDYTASVWGGDCAADGTITLAPGQVATCTITNDDDAPSLTLVKVVINDNGGTEVESAWTMTASGPTGFSGFGPSVTNADIDAGTYDLSENGPPGYSASSWVCVGGNQTDGDTVLIGLGESVTCTITNNDIPPPPPPPPPPPSPPCGCTPLTQIIVSDGTNTIGGGFAVPVATSSAWTASIPGATWIWQASSTAPNAVVAFEKSFTVSGTVLSAQLNIAADNSYKVFIDNVQVAADASANNFTLGTQDVYNLTANVTPGTHTLRIEVTNNGTFNASTNPAGLLYTFEIETCPNTPTASISITICNRGTITNTTSANSYTGENTSGGSVGGRGGRGGDILTSGRMNNGGATSGSGGNGGNAGAGGQVQTGVATSNASTTNKLNGSDVGVEAPPDMNSSSLAVAIDNLNGGCDCVTNVIGNSTRARSRTGANQAAGSTGGNGNDAGNIVAGTGDENNGGATSGSGGNGGSSSSGGTIVTGRAESESGTSNSLNVSRIRISN